MAASLGKKLAGCAFGACIAVSSAHAATGHIVFSGAVVESTCSSEVASTMVVVNGAGPATSERRSCGRTATDPGRSYSRVVTSPSAAGLKFDPLLAYFASYARPAAANKVVVQTYD